MRKVTERSVIAFENAQSFKSGNTEVEVLPNVTVLKLFGNSIAWQYNDPERTLSISDAGYQTNTTKERLNGIRGVSVQQVKGVWYLNGKEWDGSYIDVK